MHQYGVARSDQSVTGYGNPTDYDSTTGYGTTHGYGATAGSGPVVSFENVSKYYGSLKAVDGLSLDLRPGETTALLGPNGAGKSTSLDMLLALRKPTSGKITMFGSDPYHAVKSGRVGAMLQSGGLMPEVTVRELVTLVTGLHPRPEPVETTLKRAGIAKFADQRVDKLSGGQTQRVRFALALAGRPDLLFLDEPTAALDVEARRSFWQSVQTIAGQGTTVLFATHYLDEADANASRIIVVSHGRIMADGTPSQIKAYTSVRTIRFSTPVPDTSALLRLPGVNDVVASGDAVTIRSGDADTTLPALYALGGPVRGLEVGGGGLEEALIALTGGDAAVHGEPAGRAAGVSNSSDMTRVG
jgi:ABC-2 type transport system ATP-binding protein